MVDIRMIAGENRSPQLVFVLTYVFYQNNKLELALEGIKVVVRDMPESRAAKNLQQVIEAAIAKK